MRRLVWILLATCFYALACSSDSELPLIDAVKKGQLSRVERLLEDDPMSAQQKDDKGNTALHWAAKQGDEPMVKAFIAAETNLNIQNMQGDTPLIVATSVGYYPIVQDLLEASADMSIVNNHSLSAPKMALETHKSALLELFLQKGFSKAELYLPATPTRMSSQENSQAFSGLESELFANAQENHLEAFDNLLNEAASKGTLRLSNKDAQGDTLLGKLAALPDAVYISHLLQKDHTALDLTNKEGASPLATAISAGQVNNVRTLILAGAPLVTVDKELKTILHRAVLSGDEATFNLIMRNTRNISPVDIYGNTPLHYAAQNPEGAYMVRTLLESGAGINVQNRADGETPLDFAVKSGNEEVAEILLKFGANPRLTAINGKTALDLSKGTPMEALLARFSS